MAYVAVKYECRAPAATTRASLAEMYDTTLEQIAWIDDHSGGYPAIVAVDEDDLVVGFASLTAYRPRPAYAPTVEDSVYVSRTRRGEGIGGLLLTDLVALALDHGFHSIVARIVGEHDTSIALHRKCGFEEIGREREVGRKFGHWLGSARHSARNGCGLYSCGH